MLKKLKINFLSYLNIIIITGNNCDTVYSAYYTSATLFDNI